MPADAGTAEPTRAAGDLPCRRCGYDLAGLSPAMSCPECGGRVSRMRHRTLLSASPAYVRVLTWGALLVLMSTASRLSLNLLYIAFFRPELADLPIPTWNALASSLGAVAVILQFAGLWLLASRDSGCHSGRAARLRMSVRVLVLLWLLTAAASFVTVSFGVSFASLLLAVAWFVAAMRLMVHIAEEIPSEPLARWTQRMLWAGCVLFAVDLTEDTGTLLYILGLEGFDPLLDMFSSPGFGFVWRLVDLGWSAVLLVLMLAFHRMLSRRLLPGASRTRIRN